MEREVLGYEVQAKAVDDTWIAAVTELVPVEGFEDEVIYLPIDPMPKEEADDLMAYLYKLSPTLPEDHFRVEPVYK